jgi:hypothetical protein
LDEYSAIAVAVADALDAEAASRVAVDDALDAYCMEGNRRFEHAAVVFDVLNATFDAYVAGNVRLDANATAGARLDAYMAAFDV